MLRSLRIYLRLLAFARPYTARLIVGLVAALIAGGSLFGVLRYAPAMLKPFEAGGLGMTSQPQPEAAPHAGQPSTSAAQPPVTRDLKGLGGIEEYARKLGLQVTRPDGAMSWQFMLLTLLGLPVCIVFRAFAVFLGHYCLRWVGARVVVDLRNTLFSHLLKQSLKYFGKSDVGELISRCTYDTGLIESLIAGSLTDLIQAPIELLAAAVFIVWFALENDLMWVVVAIFLVFPLCVIPIVVFGRWVKRYTKRALQRLSELVSRMQEVFTGIRVIKAFHTETEEANRFRELSLAYFKMVVKALRAELFMAPMMEIVGVVCACAFLVFCYARGIQLSQIVPIGAAAILAYRPVKALAKVNASLQRGTAAAERLFSILDTDTALPEAAHPERVSQFQDRVEFRNVGFSYEPDGLPILPDLSFTLPRGHVAAFVGETGSGKSTVACLLARFYDPVTGSVLLDGHDLRDMEIASLRRLIGVVTQETILFNDTIARNIAYGTPGATRDQVMDAARKANAHDFISAEAEGYDRVVGEKGFRLSGGQRQRIAIARAILKNPPILILDEATSALDSVTEQLVQEALYRLMQERTVFVIAHRLSTVKHANCIYVLDKGRVVEHGSHDELYAAGRVYHNLCDSQFGVKPEPDKPKPEAAAT